MKVLPKGTIKRVHVNRHVLAGNLKHGRNDAALTIQTSRGPLPASVVEMRGTCRLVQAGLSAPKPLSCGARVWVETRGEVRYVT
jgi:hypothetical protein